MKRKIWLKEIYLKNVGIMCLRRNDKSRFIVMKITTIYTCEICNTEYTEKIAAERCEAQPTKKEEWQKIGEEKGFYGFGADGVIGPKKLEPGGINSKHQTIYYGMEICSSRGDRAELDWLNPYVGNGFLRYVEKQDLEKELNKWKEACNHYNLEPDIAKCDWLEDRIFKFCYKNDSSYEQIIAEGTKYFEELLKGLKGILKC